MTAATNGGGRTGTGAAGWSGAARSVAAEESRGSTLSHGTRRTGSEQRRTSSGVLAAGAGKRRSVEAVSAKFVSP